MSTQRASLHLTPESVEALDAGLYPGGGRSQRINGILARYSSIMDSLAALVAEKYRADMDAIGRLYFQNGDAGLWLRDVIEAHAEAAIGAGKYPNIKAMAAADPLVGRVLAAPAYEIAALEELVARRWAKSACTDDGPLNSPEGIKAARLYAGLTQAEAAEFAGVSLRTWAGWEAGTAAIPEDRWSQLSMDLKDLDMIADRVERKSYQQKPRRR